MIHGLANVMRREAERVGNQRMTTRIGIVTAYDPAHYAAKVRIQPEDVETGFMPVTTAWVGNGWGMFCPPTPGDVVDVHFQEGGREAGFIATRFFSTVTVPLSVPSGEFWLVHKNGAFLKFTNDGKISLNSQVEIDATAPTVNVTASTAVHITAPSIHLGSSGAGLHQIVTDALVALFNSHTHGGIMAGAAHSAPPDQQMGAGELTSIVQAQ